MDKLTSKMHQFYWGEEEENAFQLIKQKLCSALILALPEGSEDFVVYYDTSHKECDPNKQLKGSPGQAEDASCSGSTKELRLSEMKSDGIRGWG
ncbi:putative reverse transcriptase domain-containing protein [Tanacetum coccineum]